MLRSTKVRTMTVEIPYPHPDTLSDSFRVYLCKSTNGQWLNTILVVSRGDANPIDYFSDTYEGLVEFLSDEGLDITKFSIFLDMMEFYGVNSQFLFRWDIKNINKPIQSQLETVTPNQLSETERKVLESYYANKWSLFTESCLTNDEKAQLIASTLANSVYDEYGADSLQITFRYKLDEAIRSGSRTNFLQNYLK